MSNALMAVVQRLLPYSALLHILVAVWTFGDSSVLPSPQMSFIDYDLTNMYQTVMLKLSQSRGDVLHLGKMLSRLIVFPHVMLLIVLITAYLLQTTVGQLVAALLRRLGHILTRGHRCRPINSRVAKMRPQFTGPYAVQLPAGSSSSLSEWKARSGWRVRRDPVREYGNYVETKVWMSHGKCHGLRHKKEQNMLTWQVIRESTVYSYDIFANPRYNVAASALYQAHQAVGAWHETVYDSPPDESCISITGVKRMEWIVTCIDRALWWFVNSPKVSQQLAGCAVRKRHR